MKKFILLTMIILSSIICKSQSDETDSAQHDLIIGVGSDKATFQNALHFINSLSFANVSLICETQQALMISLDNTYKDDMEFIKYLTMNVEGLIVNKKDSNIFEKDCYYETFKQRK